MNLHFQERFPVGLPRGSVQLGFLRHVADEKLLIDSLVYHARADGIQR